MSNIFDIKDTSLAGKIREISAGLEARRTGNPAMGVPAEDISLSDYLGRRFSLSNGGQNEPMTLDKFMYQVGVDLNRMTMDMMITAPLDIRWLVPEIIRDAIREGLRKAPIYPNIIRNEETVAQPNVITPIVEMSSEAVPEPIGESETIGVGYVSYRSKTVGIKKRAKGIQFSYEALRFTTMNLVQVFFEDLGVRFGYSLDNEAITVLLNGNDLGGTEAISTIGVGTQNTLAFKDLLRAWLRGSRIGRDWSTMIGGETITLDVMCMDEYLKSTATGKSQANMNFQNVSIITNPRFFAHGKVADNKVILLDPSYSLTQLTALPLMVENEKIVSRQIEGSYASIMTGFTKLFRDASIQIDRSLAFSGNGFPSYVNPDLYVTD